MGLPSEDDRDAIDRAFAELVAGYHLTADPPDPFANEPPTEPVTATSPPDAADRALKRVTDPPAPDAADGEVNGASDPPLLASPETPADARSSSEEPPPDRYVPEPLPPL